MKHLTLFGYWRRTSRVKALAMFGLVAALIGAPFLVARPATAATQVQSTPVMVTMAVRSCTSATPVSSRPTVKVGDTGSCVKVLQQLLIAKGYKIGAAGADGAFGNLTKAGVIAFQKSRGLVQDGIVGPITWGKLAATTSQPKPTPAPTPKPSSSKTPVILTYDDCPVSKASSNATLKAARDLKIHLRLYVTGACLKAGKFDIAYARSMGHTVCNHSNTHANLSKLSAAGVRKELAIPGLKTNCARPPYGATNSTVRAEFKRAGLRHDLWDVDTRDWEGKSQAQVVAHAVKFSQSGDVVLMHMQHKAYNASALKAIKAGLAKRGLPVA